MAIFNGFLYVYQRVFINPLHPFASSIRYKVIPSYSHSDIDHRDIHLLWHIIIITYHRWIHQLSPFTIAIQCINAVNHRCIYHKQHISHRTCALKCAKTCFFSSGAAAVFDVCRPNQVQSARWDQFVVLWWQFGDVLKLLIRGIVPIWPYFRLVKYYNLPSYKYKYTVYICIYIYIDNIHIIYINIMIYPDGCCFF